MRNKIKKACQVLGVFLVFLVAAIFVAIAIFKGVVVALQVFAFAVIAICFILLILGVSITVWEAIDEMFEDF